MDPNANYLTDVREQYENLPYPPRNPQNEKLKLSACYGEHLEYINHYAYGGKIDLSNFNVLVAGGGTGDASIFMGEQLLGTDNRVVHLDLSETSINVAKERAKVRGLDNIEFIHGSLLDLPNMDIGTFQHINCSGVLHHLESPDAGLRALASVLDDNGGAINMMVYGQYGRTWVYHAQELLRRLNVNSTNISERIDIAMALIEGSAGYPWMKELKRALLDNEIAKMGDQGLYDLLLHSQDRAYTMPQMYDFVEGADLHLVHWVRMEVPYKHFIAPRIIQQPALRAKIESFPEREQQAILEMINGQFSKHTCYASKQPPNHASPADEDMIPNLGHFAACNWQAFQNHLVTQPDGAHVTLKDIDTHRETSILLNPVSRAFLMGIDNKTPIGKTIDKALEAGLKGGFPDFTRERAKSDFLRLFDALDQLDWVLLRHPSTDRFPTVKTLHRRVYEMYNQPVSA